MFPVVLTALQRIFSKMEINVPSKNIVVMYFLLHVYGTSLLTCIFFLIFYQGSATKLPLCKHTVLDNVSACLIKKLQYNMMVYPSNSLDGYSQLITWQRRLNIAVGLNEVHAVMNKHCVWNRSDVDYWILAVCLLVWPCWFDCSLDDFYRERRCSQGNNLGSNRHTLLFAEW